MSKETEELLLIGGGLFLLLTLLNNGGGSALSLAKLNAATNVGYANAGASVINTALNDFSD